MTQRPRGRADRRGRGTSGPAAKPPRADKDARTSRARRLRGTAPLLVLAGVVYVPLLLTAPGVVGADTKAYLYLDPGRLLARATSMWDPSIGLGTVTHQNLGYLWPMGPFYWLCEALAVPDWIAQRLWLGTLLVVAGAGVRYLMHTLDRRGPSVTAAMFLYALSPYILTLAARLSVILLPFAGLPWLIALTVRALRHGGWRHPAAFALVVTTIGSVNATALLLAGVGPLLWVAHAVLVTKEVRPARAAAAVGRIGVLTVACSLWWLAGLAVQGGYGIEILRYTETAKTVAAASLAPEVLRGLGYWFFYGDDRLGPWIEPSVPYTQRLGLLTATYLIPVLGLVAAGLSRWRHRAFLVALVVTGTLLAVGAHPWDDPPLLGQGIKAFLLSDVGLAMRSLPRAVPLVALGMALLLANGVAALGARVARLARPTAYGAAALAVLALPPLWTGDLVADNLQRPEDLPARWPAIAEHLDARDPIAGEGATRVLAIPGSDFASYRWGNTVDPVLPGLMDRPYVARELIPYGSPASADLLNALDRRLQEDVADPAALAPIARLMGAGDVVVRSDLQYERYRTPRPRILWDLVRRAPGLGRPVGFGIVAPNRPDADAPLQDELALNTDPDLPDPPPVAAVPVEDPQAVVRAHDADRPLIVAGNGEGLVELAGAGLLEGDELIFYSGSFADDPDRLADLAGDDATLVVTDTNRKAGQRWTTVRHNRGLTEEAGAAPLARDLTDNRLPLFPDAGDDSFTVARHRGGVHARATSTGNPITYTPEDRPAHAVDGDPRTAWRTGAFDAASGERLELRFDAPVTTDRLTLLQPVTGLVNRYITEVRLRFDGGEPVDVTLDEASRREPGQQLRFSERRFEELGIEVVADTAGERTRYAGLTGLGFAEVVIEDADQGAILLDEVIRLPRDLLAATGEDSLDQPLALLLARARSDPSEATRSDEEPALARAFELPTDRAFAVSGDVRLSPRADDDVLDRVLGLPDATAGGVTATSSDRLPGGRDKRASAAIDGDRRTAWTSPFGAVVDQWVEYLSATPLPGGRMDLTVVADGRHSVPTRLGFTADGRPAGSVAVAPIDDGERSGHTATVALTLPEEARGATTLRVTVEDIRPVTTIDWYSGEPIAQPVAIAELGIAGLRLGPAGADLDDRCRDDLLTVDGDAVDVRVDGASADAVAGRPLTLTACDPAIDLAAGEHLLRTVAGRDHGLDIDRLVLRSAAGGAAEPGTGLLVGAGADPDEGRAVAVRDDDRWRLTAEVTEATPGEPFWLVLGQSRNDGWEASVDGEDLGPPTLVDGFANGWLVEPDQGELTVDLVFAPQRTVRWALVLSALAVLACVALAARRPRATSIERIPEPRALELGTGLRYHGRRPATRPAVIATVTMGLATFVVAGPIAGVVVAAFTAGALRWARLRPLLSLGAPGALALAGAHVVVNQWRSGFAPGFEWPAELASVHMLGLLAVALLAADVVVDRLWLGHGTPPASGVDFGRPATQIDARRTGIRRWRGAAGRA